MERPANIFRAVAELHGYTFERRQLNTGRYIHLYHQGSGQWSADDLPHWDSNLDDAIVLFDNMPHEYTPRLVRLLAPHDGKLVSVWKACILHNVTHGQIEAEDSDPSTAICLAWLEYKQKE